MLLKDRATNETMMDTDILAKRDGRLSEVYIDPKPAETYSYTFAYTELLAAA